MIGYGLLLQFSNTPPLIGCYFIMVLRQIYKPPCDVFITPLIRVSYHPIGGRHVALVYAGVCSLFCIHLFLLGFYSGKKQWVVCHAYGIYRITIYIYIL